MNESLSSKIVTLSVFFFTITIVGISTISVIFPALIISNTYEFPHQLEPFETSPWLIPIIISILTLLGIRYLFIKDKLPSIFNSTIKFIFNFEKKFQS